MHSVSYKDIYCDILWINTTVGVYSIQYPVFYNWDCVWNCPHTHIHYSLFGQFWDEHTQLLITIVKLKEVDLSEERKKEDVDGTNQKGWVEKEAEKKRGSSPVGGTIELMITVEMQWAVSQT